MGFWEQFNMIDKSMFDKNALNGVVLGLIIGAMGLVIQFGILDKI